MAGAAIGQRGYLLVLRRIARGDSDQPATDWSLQFIDPEDASSPFAEVGVRGLVEPVALAYGVRPRPSEPLLYALETSSNDPTIRGVVRIDAEAQGAGATLVLPVSAPRSFAVGPDGALYVTAGQEGSPGELLRVAGQY